jgi:hypothetical protein
MSEVMEKTLSAHQIELERLFSKNQLLPRIRSEFTTTKDVDFTGYLTEMKIPIGFGIDLLAQMALHKRVNLPTLIGVLRHHFDDSQITADMILRCAEADLVDWSPTIRMFIVKFTITQDVQRELDRFQYPLPMVVRPRLIQDNRDTGYMLGRGSVILKHNHTDDDVCLDHLNRMNKVPFTINMATALMVRNQWRNLDKAKEGETKQDFERRKKAFEKYDRTAKDVMALLMQHSDKFWMTHRYDKRGRCYCQGYHVNYQGTPWNKAVVEFAEKEHVT